LVFSFSFSFPSRLSLSSNMEMYDLSEWNGKWEIESKPTKHLSCSVPFHLVTYLYFRHWNWPRPQGLDLSSWRWVPSGSGLFNSCRFGEEAVIG
jgi:hypothetical protein